MADSEYLEAAEEARGALYDLLMLTEPHRGRNLRVAYADLKQWIDTNAPEDPAEAEARAAKERAEYQRRTAWRSTSMDRREAYVFQFLGEERLTIGELTERATKALHVDYQIFDSNIRSTVNRMFQAGQLEREGEEWHSRIRYRYFRKRTLEGPIADLQTALDEGGEA
jgi:hypothetical protein